MHLIIDADPLVYSCGFSAETTAYHLVTEDQETGAIEEAYFAPYNGQTAGSRMQKFIQDNPQLEVIEKERRVIPDTEENAIAAVRTKLFSIEKEAREHYKTDFSRITTILSGPGNYRDSIATRFPYKGNRDPTHKPYWYQSIRNYITGSWGGIVVSGREADDECSIIARKELAEGTDFVVATIDKDLDQIPGKHFNYLKRVFYATSISESIDFFYEQCLSGDATDGIPGCWKCGPAAARKLVQSVRLHGEYTESSASHNPNLGSARQLWADPASRTTEPTATNRFCHMAESESVRGVSDSDRAMWAAIVSAYETSAFKAGCPYARSDAEAFAVETSRLVFLQHYEGQLWCPPPGPHGWLPGYGSDDD